MTWDPDSRLLTIEEAARSLERPESTIRRWIAEGYLRPFARINRKTLYLESDVLRVEADTRLRRARAVGAE